MPWWWWLGVIGELGVLGFSVYVLVKVARGPR